MSSNLIETFFFDPSIPWVMFFKIVFGSFFILFFGGKIVTLWKKRSENPRRIWEKIKISDADFFTKSEKILRKIYPEFSHLSQQKITEIHPDPNIQKIFKILEKARYSQKKISSSDRDFVYKNIDTKIKNAGN